MIGQRDEFLHRRLIEHKLTGVKRPTTIRRDLIRVRARLAFRRDTLKLATAEARPVEKSLRGIVRRGDEVKPLVLLIHMDEVGHIVITLCDQLRSSALALGEVEVLPAVAFAPEDKPLAALDPLQILDARPPTPRRRR